MTRNLEAALSFEAKLNADRRITKSEKATLSFAAAINTVRTITHGNKADLILRAKLNRGLIQKREEAHLLFTAFLGRKIKRAQQAELTMIGALYQKAIIHTRAMLILTATLDRNPTKGIESGLGLGVANNKLRIIGGPDAGERYWTQGTEHTKQLSASVGLTASPFEPRFIP